jgi:hypothetical protein
LFATVFREGEKEGFNDLIIVATTADEFPGSLKSQAAALKRLHRARDVPGWVIVTPRGLACRVCRDADKMKFVVYGANPRTWRTSPFVKPAVGEAIKSQLSGQQSAVKLQEAARLGAKVKKSTHTKRVRSNIDMCGCFRLCFYPGFILILNQGIALQTSLSPGFAV